jgi:hypothetical protein
MGNARDFFSVKRVSKGAARKLAYSKLFKNIFKEQ